MHVQNSRRRGRHTVFFGPSQGHFPPREPTALFFLSLSHLFHAAGAVCPASIGLRVRFRSQKEQSQVPILTWDQFTRVETSTKILGLKQMLWNTNMENSTENENSRAIASPRGEGGTEFQQQHRGLSACSRKLALHLATKKRALPLTHTIQKTGIGKRPWYVTYPCLVWKGRTVVQRKGVPF